MGDMYACDECIVEHGMPCSSSACGIYEGTSGKAELELRETKQVEHQEQLHPSASQNKEDKNLQNSVRPTASQRGRHLLRESL